MLLRGQNLLGYRNYPDDIVERFVKKSIQNGIDIVRIFDALNDVRNLKTACEATKKYGGHAQLAMSYTISPVHTIEYYKNLALEMQEIGADSIAIKDMSGILLPEVAYELVSALKSVLRVPVEVHTHATAGLASMTYIKAVEAGADIIDTAISPLSGGTSQPATESIVRAFQGTERETGFDLELLKEIAEYFKPIRAKYLQEGILNPQALMTEPSIVEYQLPGGMLSNFLSQLKMQKAEHKYEDVLREIPRVRADLGYPPLVTPLSQMVGTQAIFNILTGQRYKLIPNEIKNYVRGLYGKSPVPITDEIKKTIIGTEEVFTGRPADKIAPEYDKLVEDWVKSKIIGVPHIPDNELVWIGRQKKVETPDTIMITPIDIHQPKSLSFYLSNQSKTLITREKSTGSLGEYSVYRLNKKNYEKLLSLGFMKLEDFIEANKEELSKAVNTWRRVLDIQKDNNLVQLKFREELVDEVFDNRGKYKYGMNYLKDLNTHPDYKWIDRVHRLVILYGCEYYGEPEDRLMRKKIFNKLCADNLEFDDEGYLVGIKKDNYLWK